MDRTQQGLSYFDLDRLYTECVERNFRGDSNTIGSVISQATYALCWNAFSKWCLSQIELNRAVNVPVFGTIGFQAIRENLKVLYVRLSGHFLQNHGLQYKQGQQELEAQQTIIMDPTVKPNYPAMSKAAGIDKQVLQNSLNNIFQLIGDLMTESQNVEIDLQEFGKFSSINRQVIYASLNKQKPSAFQGKQTVKSLMDLGSSTANKYQSAQKNNGNFAEATQQMMMSSKLHGSIGSQGGHLQGSLFRSNMPGALNESPTRRFKKPFGEGKITSDLLGAGDDPMAKNQEFSLLANNPAQLMALSFKKPSKAQSRYPPVIDPFSRTLAAPISSQRHYFSVCHRIGTNFTPSGKGFYIDTDTRTIKYKDVNDTGTKLDIVGSDDVEPADEREEYEAVLNPKNSDRRRIQARKISYQRYRQYVENEISVDVIAPIRQYWLSHIIELIPGDLHAVEKDRIEYLIDSMLNEINKDYFDSVRKSILDYILKDDNEMRRLGIQQVLNQPTDWGDDFYKGIEPNEEWKHNVMMARMLMSENLCICSQATLELMKLWQEYENYLFVKLPQPREEPVFLVQFLEQQDNQMNKVKGLLSSDWNKSSVDILREELENLDKDQTKTFFESVATLMANQVRELISKSVKSYVEFFRRFKKREYPTPQEIIKREYDPDTPFEDNFLILKLTVDGQRITFSDQLNVVKRDLEKIVELIVQQSQNLPRPENTIARSDKMHLWDVPIEDDLVRNAQNEIHEILEKNIDAVEEALHVYDDYLFILREKARIEHFLSEEPLKRESFIAEITKYEETIRSIRENMPFEIRMNMFLIDCADLNNKLCAECEDLIDKILSKIADYVFNEQSAKIISEVKKINENFATKAENSRKLVQFEKELEEIKIVRKQQLVSDYNDLIEWLILLYNNPRYKVPEDQTRSINSAYLQTCKLNSMVEMQENKLKNERVEIENKLVQKKSSFLSDLAAEKANVDKFKDNDNKKKEDEYNQNISTINQQLALLTEDMININEQEADLDFPISEYPLIDELKQAIKPYEELWKLVKNFNQRNSLWNDGELFKLDPEEVDKDHKQMFQTSNKLINRFQAARLSKPEKIANDIKNELHKFREYLPIIRSLCNPGLKPRHMEEIKKLIDKPIEKNEKLKTLRDLGIEQYKDKLEDISETASKEYSNERTLIKMNEDWTPMEFACKDWKGSFILDGEAIELIQALLDDHIIKTQTMKGSPFAKVFLKEITQWETNLLKTQENLDVWLKVQSVWLYLEPVFSSEDIMKQMPVEGTKFREVDRAWRSLMNRISDNPKALDVIQIEELGDILKECHAKLEQVQKGLNDYLESKRQLFPRFYFLSNDELLEILSETKEPLRVQPHLKKCFEGIAALEFDEEKKIHAMYSSEGEQVPFTRIIDPIASKGQVEDWLRQVEEVMLKSVKDIVEKALQDYSKKDRERWVTSWQGQAVLAVDMMFWTSQAEEAMKKSGVAGLQQYYDKLNRQVSINLKVIMLLQFAFVDN